ncbi:Protein CbxX, plasmid [Fusarium culmorum]|uniref:Protein CbxX, plasmid n=1 Tax=Fusarium culmorum TaxID=5516 RepID=A0A2T4GVN9_FUSCU|nr:Protein CbxX, plasmid [Fusarium culmorum]
MTMSETDHPSASPEQDDPSNQCPEDNSEKGKENELKWTEDDSLLLEEEDFESIADKSPSQIEWSRRKREENQQNEPLDRVMCMIGHEEVKAYFLSIMDKVNLLKRWNKNLNDWSFDLVLKGVYGPEFLYSVGVVHSRQFAINEGYSPSRQDSMATVVLFSNADRIDETSDIEKILRVAKKPEFRTVTIPYEVLGDNSKEALDVNEESKRRFSNRLILDDYGEKETIQFMKRFCRSKPEYSPGPADTQAPRWDQFKNANTLPREIKEVWKKSQARIQYACCSWAKTHSPGDGHEFPAEGDNRDEIILADILERPPTPEIEDSRVESPAWKSIQQLVGLKPVKEELELIFDMAVYNKHQEKHGRQPLATTYNRCFLGSPGVGKTTVAELYAKMLSELGIISRGHIITKRASDLISKYVGGSEARTTRALEEAKGGVLIIDDAHLLYQGPSRNESPDSFRNGIIDTLVANISGTVDEDRCVILCGYAETMEAMFLKTNPRLQRRFPIENSLHFDNYDEEQLHQILKQKMERDNLIATDEAHVVAREILSRMSRKPNFGNGGDVENLLSRAKVHRITRLKDSNIGFADFHKQALQPQDFDPDFDRPAELTSTETLCSRTLWVLTVSLVNSEGTKRWPMGCDDAELIQSRLSLGHSSSVDLPELARHRTTARKVGRLFYDMGFISSSTVVTCSVTNLIGRSMGHTGPKVIDQFERGLGKVLFIDEAYRLVGDSFHQDAIGEIVDAMTKPRYAHNMVIILVGYSQEMETLLHANPGLRSRFRTIIKFSHMSPQHCLQLLSTLLAKVNIGIPKSAIQPSTQENTMLIRALTQLTATKGWASGRDIETLSENIAGHVFTKVGESDDVYEPGTLQVSFEELMDSLGAMLNERGAIWTRLTEDKN